MSEQWISVVGYEGLYEVSDRGRVRSVERVYHPGRPGTPARIKPSRELRPDVNRKGYHAVKLYRNGKGKAFPIHRLVLISFVGPPHLGMETCHNNGNPGDNRLSNLRWGTSAENVADQISHGTQRNKFRTHCIHGHEFTLENTYHLTQNGRPRRMCKQCCRNREQARRQTRKASA